MSNGAKSFSKNRKYWKLVLLEIGNIWHSPHLGGVGQSLLEVVVLIGLALVIVTGLTIVTINGLKNSQFSQNQAQATRLAQDAIDKIRTMKDQNCPVTISGIPYYWYDASTYPNQIWTQTFSNTTFKFISNVNCGPAQPAGTGLQNPAGLGGVDDSIPATLQTTFNRKITINDDTASSKKINVIVNWTDISGTHQSSLATILGEN